MKKIVFISLILIIAASSAMPSYSRKISVFFPGEVLEYEVSFYGVKLGKIKIESYGEETFEGVKVYKSKMWVDSYRGIPFVDLHATFESLMDNSLSFSRLFQGNMKDEEGIWCYQKITYDYKANKMKNTKWKVKDIFFNKETVIKEKINDGCSIFFLARQYTDIKKSAKIATVMDKDLNYTYLNFQNKKENISIDAVKYDIKTIYFDGKADWKGLYGLSGNFEGWFSDDDASVPIKAKMNVYIGNVNIELVKWKRGTWAPPKAG